jgi:23S rRNA pseudouridine1911/1915/1917 synthase
LCVQVRAGDALLLTLAPLPPMEAAPEALPLDVVFEDDSVLVVNKAAHMVVHPSAGHAVRDSLGFDSNIDGHASDDVSHGVAERHAGERGAAPLRAAGDARGVRLGAAGGAVSRGGR